jgi:hypothetical protein
MNKINIKKVKELVKRIHSQLVIKVLVKVLRTEVREAWGLII